MHHTTFTHSDEADCAYGAGLVIGRLEVDGREIEAHRMAILTLFCSGSGGFE
jgi:hypothetical protein